MKLFDINAYVKIKLVNIEVYTKMEDLEYYQTYHFIKIFYPKRERDFITCNAANETSISF